MLPQWVLSGVAPNTLELAIRVRGRHPAGEIDPPSRRRSGKTSDCIARHTMMPDDLSDAEPL
jgi:hypothetical protein